MAQTTTKPTRQTKPKEEMPQQQNAVAVLPPPRLAPPANLEKDFGLDANGWRTMVEAVFPAARSTQAVSMALAYCKARKLDPFKRVVHIVPIYDSQKRAYVETVWPGIAEIRTTAMRTQGYAGMDRPEFGDMLRETFEGRIKDGDAWKDVKVELVFPEWCQITVWRFVQGQRVPFPGPRIWFHEIYNPINRFAKVPNERWQRSPSQMLEKCAEAAALRRAFPEELGDEWSAEEAGGMVHTQVDITQDGHASTAPAEPKPSDYQQQPSVPAQPHGEGAGAGQPGEKTAADPTAAPGQPGDKKKKGPVTDVEPEPAPPKIEFEVFETARAFFDFSDNWLVDPARTEGELIAWEEFYRDKIKEMAEHKFPRIREAIAQTLGDYSAALNRVRGQQ